MKAALFLVVSIALLPVSSTAAEAKTEADTEAKAEQDHASVTVFDMFDLSPEQFATLLGQSGE